MIDRAHDLPITKQAAALNISGGSVYYLPRPVSAAERLLDSITRAGGLKGQGHDPGWALFTKRIAPDKAQAKVPKPV